MTGWKANALVALVVVSLTIILRRLLIRILRQNNKPRSGKLETISSPENPKFEIIAVHGLGADPKYTWSHPAALGSDNRTQAFDTSEPQGPPASPDRIHLLRDLMRNDFSEARILSFEHNSQWLLDTPVQTTAAIGQNLLRELKSKHSSHLPIIFIGHSLGGIIIKEALYKDVSKEIIKDVSGIIFLGTPHQGSSVSKGGAILAFITRFLGSEPALLLSLRRHSDQLSDISEGFGKLIPRDRIIAFFEKKKTYVLRCLSLGVVVPRDSAVEHSDEDQRHGFDTDHSGLNKCAGPNDDLYAVLKRSIHSLRAPSPLETADTVIKNNCYTEEKLRIEGLSGRTLSMEQCYINLAIVEQTRNRADRQDRGPSKTSAFSLSARLKIETPEEETQIALSAMFNPRKGVDGQTARPRKIWIRGRAGVGKTTLCKKMVHDFKNGTMWNELFDRVLWIPLRKLKQRMDRGRYSLKDLFIDEFFSQHKDTERLAEALYDACNLPSNRSLFILDGMDEIWHDLSPENDMQNFIIKTLLEQPNIIVTARPSVTPPVDFHLDLETIGFYPHQVSEYIRNAESEKMARDIQTFVDSRPLIRGLVRIPIQLDAVCCAWDNVYDNAPETMTGLYQAIQRGLGTKDAVRLNKKLQDKPLHEKVVLRPGEVKHLTKSETDTIIGLAFTGMYNDVIYFDPKCQNLVSTHIAPDQVAIDEILQRVSYLRSSDNSENEIYRTYHFLHLTLQEYFSARYFFEKWVKKEKLKCLSLSTAKLKVDHVEPVVFLQKEKYSARYDIFWRFVAGLLATEGDDSMIADFFDEIHKKPLDLLGPAHQRLVMHCLSEIPRDMENGDINFPYRKKLEDGLKEWLLFEYRYTGEVNLAREMEFPEHALDAAFDEGTDKMKRAVLRAVSKRATLPNLMLKPVTSWLDDEKSGVRDAAVGALAKRPDLPEGLLNALATRINDKDSGVRDAAVRALAKRPDLPEGLLNALAARLNDEDSGVRHAAAEALLREQKEFYCGLLEDPLVRSLYKVLLELSFKKQFSWYIDNSDCCINTPEGTRRIFVSNQTANVEDIVREIAHYLNYVADFWSSLVDNDLPSLARIDQQTVEVLQLMAPSVESAEVHGLVVSGQAFSKFELPEREAIWNKLRSLNGLIPSLYAFFEDFKCFENWTHCLKRIFPVTEATLRATMERQWEPPNDDANTCLVQHSPSEFSRWTEPVTTPFDISYRQMWMYAMRHYPQMPREPKRQTRLAKPATVTADECAVVDMASLAGQLGFRSSAIAALRQRSADRAIAMNALLQARKPDRFTYDASTLESLIDQITSCFRMARPIGSGAAPPSLLGPAVKQKARCGHPTIQDLSRNSPSLFLPYMHTAEIPDRVTTFYIWRHVYLVFFGPPPTFGGDTSRSDLFVPRSPPSVDMSPLITPAYGDAVSTDHFSTREGGTASSNQPFEATAQPQPANDGDSTGQEDTGSTRHAVVLQSTEREPRSPGNEASSQPLERHLQISRPVTQFDMAGVLTARNKAHSERNVPELPETQPEAPENEESPDASHQSPHRSNGLREARVDGSTNQATTERSTARLARNIPASEQQAAKGPIPGTQQNTIRPTAEKDNPGEREGEDGLQVYPNSASQERNEAAETPTSHSRRLHQTHDTGINQAYQARTDTEAGTDDMAGDIILMDAEQREMGEQGQPIAQLQPATSDSPERGRLEEDSHVESERADALARLQAGQNSPTGMDIDSDSGHNPRPHTQMDITELLVQTREGSAHSESNTAFDRRSPQERSTRPHQQPSKPAGVGKMRKNPKPNTRDVNRAGTRDAAIADHLEWDLAENDTVTVPRTSRDDATGRERPEAPETSVARRQVRFDVSNDERALNEPEATPSSGVVRPQRVTQYNFKRLAGNPQRGVEAEAGQPPGDGRVNITFYLYENEQWTIVNVVRVNPSQPSELVRTVREYKRHGMILHDMKMRTVSISSSFTAATADGANVLLLIPRKTKQRMGRRRRIEPPNVVRGQ
ncbi:uncharacterized protein LDX57_008201 [Aspergillus melleus]|uniref:uncharacterized protein n=1 Tax=Aspergillus melleus TaxID=138277 RepID=UPI001E8E3F91|nr:uncharacterized protein LDX57_008201 [Aspergillus melleus]KAH8430537.1 hypothetical protein LDX57_008201 [Aspergillus melleus]